MNCTPSVNCAVLAGSGYTKMMILKETIRIALLKISTKRISTCTISRKRAGNILNIKQRLSSLKRHVFSDLIPLLFVNAPMTWKWLSGFFVISLIV